MWNLNSTNLLLDIIRALEHQQQQLDELQRQLEEQHLMVTKLYALYDFLKHLLLAYWKHSALVSLALGILYYFL